MMMVAIFFFCYFIQQKYFLEIIFRIILYSFSPVLLYAILINRDRAVIIIIIIMVLNKIEEKKKQKIKTKTFWKSFLHFLLLILNWIFFSSSGKLIFSFCSLKNRKEIKIFCFTSTSAIIRNLFLLLQFCFFGLKKESLKCWTFQNCEWEKSIFSPKMLESHWRVNKHHRFFSEKKKNSNDDEKNKKKKRIFTTNYEKVTNNSSEYSNKKKKVHLFYEFRSHNPFWFFGYKNIKFFLS